MKKVIKTVSIVFLGLFALLGIVAFVLHKVGSTRLAGAPSVSVKAVSVPADETSLSRGAHLAAISACSVCHGTGLGGAVFIDVAPIGYIPAPNLTTGKGGVGKQYSDADWATAIRHGIAKDGRTIVIMPSDQYSSYSNDDLGALIAYLKSLPPIDNETGPRRIKFPGTVIFGVLAYDSWAAPIIDHGAVGSADAPMIEASAAYGEYLVSIGACRGCHGAALEGSTETPPAPNLTPGGRLAGWTEQDFAAAIRTGLTPDNRVLSAEMPWRNLAQMTDTEVGALWVYLSSLDAIESEDPAE